MLREEWLGKAVDLLRPYFTERGYTIPELVKVSCGFGPYAPRKTEGTCFKAANCVDGVKQIYISPELSDSYKVLDVLTHELIHASLEDGDDHKKPFKQACKKLGLEGPAKQAYAGEDLKKHLESFLFENHSIAALLVEDAYLPKYPHAKVVFKHEDEKPQTSRMHKLVCPANDDHEIDIIVRASKKVTALGIPSCFCSKPFEIAEEKKEE